MTTLSKIRQAALVLLFCRGEQATAHFGRAQGSNILGSWFVVWGCRWYSFRVQRVPLIRESEGTLNIYIHFCSLGVSRASFKAVPRLAEENGLEPTLKG